ncbi:hypothetical protein BKA83DRAFT_120572 [Pisolithus microcarpus]|nr:hypothetical protein BKA83DRAFT_120572 [Pisolithus microcarpus]
MGEFKNIPELQGTENYYEWLYICISNGAHPFHYVKYTLTCLCPLILTALTTTEWEAMRMWFKDDGLVKLIVLRKINLSVLMLIPDNITITAREVWNTLTEVYDQANVSLQFSLSKRISTLQMKGATDAEKYVASHVHANDRLAHMGAKLSDADAINALL